jgi:hypothetical protein
LARALHSSDATKTKCATDIADGRLMVFEDDKGSKKKSVVYSAPFPISPEKKLFYVSPSIIQA